MCGIVAYTGHREAYPILINGLRRLEYRGYDSAGIALLNRQQLNLYKTPGKVSDLDRYTQGKEVSGNTGIAHTRWATHGEPNEANAHPHYSESGNLALIHNGIIENYLTLKTTLEERGYKFISQTDTEVLLYLIEDIYKNQEFSLFEAIQQALSQVIGAYAIVVISKDHPDQLIAARKSSPLVIGLGDNEMFVASDATPLIEYTSEVVYLNDEEVALIKSGEKLRIRTIDNMVKSPYIQTLELSLSSLEKEGFEHFMLKEIFEQPKSVMDSMRGRLKTQRGIVSLGGIREYEQKLVNADRILMIGCGTSWHAGLVGEYLIEDLARIPVEVEYASEFRYRNPVIHEKDVVIAISQSGETADTLAAIELAKAKGATIIGICNVVGSSIARITDAGSYTHAGPEIGVASTKAFTAQVTILTLLALRLAQLKGSLPTSRFHHLINEMELLPEKITHALKANTMVKELAKIYTYARNFLYLGRGYNYPVALEGALKLKEISYIHAEGYPAAEMKHGPIALIDHEMPVVIIATKRGGIYEKILSNMQEIKARNGKIIAIVTEGDTDVKHIADYVLEIPDTDEILSPIVATIPLQLLAYHIAVMRGTNVDQPRNLAKSVTVE
ncbi:MAG: glutamine--fructose-6-phosphate transaminase (isomerizing) [Bacteroidetes bacterium]|nr:MAG: glutamine--fructose-6-phosphate transaminase (isomerizing) [Bacteroidota bacterium]